MARKVNYLNNKDMLAEIHKSKLTYCWVLDECYQKEDIILIDIDEINNGWLSFNELTAIEQARENKAKRIKDNIAAKLKAEKDKKVKTADITVLPSSIEINELVFRIMTYEHIPLDPTRKKTPKTVADHHSKVNFPPFKHYAYIDNTLTEVLRSHWEGDLDTGQWNIEHGEVTNTLAKMYMKLVERYSHRSNWRGYTYVDEMRGQALLQLSQIGLQFNEMKSQNPFAYYTAAITNSFTRILNVEKRNQNIRDDILQQAGAMPSFTRQMKNDEEQAEKRRQKLASNDKNTEQT